MHQEEVYRICPDPDFADRKAASSTRKKRRVKATKLAKTEKPDDEDEDEDEGGSEDGIGSEYEGGGGSGMAEMEAETKEADAETAEVEAVSGAGGGSGDEKTSWESTIIAVCFLWISAGLFGILGSIEESSASIGSLESLLLGNL